MVKAEDIAKFPDKYLAESWQSIPGVVFSRDGDAGRNITVRGCGSPFTRVLVTPLTRRTFKDGVLKNYLIP